MKATGIVRRIDDLGRIVIPKEIRRACHQISRGLIGVKVRMLLIAVRGAALELEARLHIKVRRVFPRRLVIRQAQRHHTLARMARRAEAVADPAEAVACAVAVAAEVAALLSEVAALAAEVAAADCEAAAASSDASAASRAASVAARITGICGLTSPTGPCGPTATTSTISAGAVSITTTVPTSCAIRISDIARHLLG